MAKKVLVKDAWKQLFDELNIVEEVDKNGIFYIKAERIKILKEPRLMAKFDQSSQLPEIFKTNNLSILPISRSEYVIGRFKTHQVLDYPLNCQPILINDLELETLNFSNLNSEANALMFAFNSGIIKDALNSTEVFVTITGRSTTDQFNFKIDSSNEDYKIDISVTNAQIEIDGGYEDENIFCIVEAKNLAVEEFIIRQLYYPYRLWKSRIKKEIIPVFLVFSNDIFHVFIYKFDNEFEYNSIKLLGYKSYALDKGKITNSDLLMIMKTLEVRTEPIVPFPQANSFERLLDLLSYLFENELKKDETTFKYDFDPRQTDYYITAGVYLDLIERYKNEDKEIVYKLTESATRIMSLNLKDKYLNLIKRIAEYPVFNKVLRESLANGYIASIKDITNFMEDSCLTINKTTKIRRASTVYSWIYWIFKQIDE